MSLTRYMCASRGYLCTYISLVALFVGERQLAVMVKHITWPSLYLHFTFALFVGERHVAIVVKHVTWPSLYLHVMGRETLSAGCARRTSVLSERCAAVRLGVLIEWCCVNSIRATPNRVLPGWYCLVGTGAVRFG